MDDYLLTAAIAYKYGNIVTPEELIQLQSRVLPLDEKTSLNNFIINTYSYSTADLQFKLMTEFLIATVEELDTNPNGSIRWNIAATRSAIEISIIHVFNKIVKLLVTEGHIHPVTHMKGYVTEATLNVSKDSLIFRLDGS